MKDLGITCPVLINPLKVYEEEIADPNAEGAAAGAGGMAAVRGSEPGLGPGVPDITATAEWNPDDATGANTIKLQRFDFVVHFCWQPKTPSERHNAQKTAEKAKTPRNRSVRNQARRPSWTSSRSYLSIVAKYQFWILCGVILLTSMGCWWWATKDLANRFQQRKSTIEDAFQKVAHPAESSQ